LKLRVLDAIQSTHERRVAPPYRRIKVNFNVEPSNELNIMPDWRRFKTRLTVGVDNNAPLEAAPEVLRLSRNMIADELYGEIYDKLREIRVEMYEQGVGLYGEERKIFEMLDEVIRALKE
jgi:hypothetical protein